MLLNTTSKFKKDDIITLKNNLGEEMIAKYVSETDTDYTLNKPVALGMGQEGQLQFMPPLMSGECEGDVDFPKASVMWIVPTMTEFESNYTQQMTGIAVPAKNKKIIV